MAAAICRPIPGASTTPPRPGPTPAPASSEMPTTYLKRLYFDSLVYTHHQLEYLVDAIRRRSHPGGHRLPRRYGRDRPDRLYRRRPGPRRFRSAARSSAATRPGCSASRCRRLQARGNAARIGRSLRRHRLSAAPGRCCGHCRRAPRQGRRASPRPDRDAAAPAIRRPRPAPRRASFAMTRAAG